MPSSTATNASYEGEKRRNAATSDRTAPDSKSPPTKKERRSRTRSPPTSESSHHRSDAKIDQENNAKAANKEKEKRPEWDMFADQDVDSNFDVSRWIVNFIQRIRKKN